MRTDLDKIKTGVDNSIDALSSIEVDGLDEGRLPNSPILATNLKKIKNSIEVYEEGVSAIKTMIDFVYEQSLEDNVDSNTWLSKRITSLIDLSKESMDNLMKGITMILPNEKSEQAKEFFKLKNEILSDWGKIDKVKKSLEKVLASKVKGKISLEEESVFEESWCEEHADNSYGKAGYDEELDLIMIDPNGTVGEVIDCYGLKMALPIAPTDRSEYLNGDVKTSKAQMWHREAKPDITRKTERKHKKYIEDQFAKKRNGVWFFNNGKPTYITGAHWLLMQWGKTNAKHGGYFHFRQAHKDLFYFMEACYVDPRSLGMILTKTRRTGATFAALMFELAKAITRRDSAFGMTSKTNLDAKKNFGYLTKMFRYLPFWFQPLSLSDDSKSKLEFLQPSSKTSTKNIGKEKSYVALETEMSYLSTSEDSYDGYALNIYIADEFSKWQKGNNIDSHWDKVSLVMTEGGNVDGIALILSTIEYVTGTEDLESSDAGSGDRYKKLFHDSDPNDRNENGQTRSGLYQLFIPCDDNYGGYIDQYGNAVKRLKKGETVIGVDGKLIRKGVLDYLDIKSNSVKNAGKLNDFWRKNPRDIDEAFRVASEDCIFAGIDTIIAQINDNSKFYDPSTQRSELYKRGRFEWENGVRDTRVSFIEDPNGKFYVAWIPEPHNQNKFRRIGGSKTPMQTDIGHLSVDPYRANKVKGGGSKAGIHGMFTMEEGGGFFLEYIDREKDVDSLAEEIIKISFFYGMKALVENNVADTLKYAKNRGYRNYAMDRPDKPRKKLSGNDKDYGGMPGTSKDLISTLTNQIEMYLTNFMNIDDEEMRHNMPFNRTLMQWMTYNPDKRTKSDAAVSSSLAIFANNRTLQAAVKTEKKRVNMTGAIPQYKKDGQYSRRIQLSK